MSARIAPSARVHYGVGRGLAWLGWNAGAAQAFTDAVRADPGFSAAHLSLGEALAHRGRWADAVQAFRAAARLSPGDVEAQGNLVLALGRTGRWCEAMDALHRLIRLRPEAELHLLLGILLRRAGRPQDAIREFRWAVGLEPRPASRRFFLGEALLGPESWAQAVSTYRDARAVPRRSAGEPPVRESPLNRAPEREGGASRHVSKAMR